jgi:hypothetical protein
MTHLDFNVEAVGHVVDQNKVRWRLTIRVFSLVQVQLYKILYLDFKIIIWIHLVLVERRKRRLSHSGRVQNRMGRDREWWVENPDPPGEPALARFGMYPRRNFQLL